MVRAPEIQLQDAFTYRFGRRCHKLDHGLILTIEQKNLGGNTDRLAPFRKSQIPEFSVFGSRDEMSASGKVVVDGGLDRQEALG